MGIKVQPVTIIFIINGVDVAIVADPDNSLMVARDEALFLSNNATRRSLSDWVIRDERGVTLPPEQRVERFNFENDVRLFLMPFAGAGGATNKKK